MDSGPGPGLMKNGLKFTKVCCVYVWGSLGSSPESQSPLWIHHLGLVDLRSFMNAMPLPTAHTHTLARFECSSK